MIRWFFERQMAAFEREFDYDLSYGRDILAAGVRPLLAFSRIMKMSSYHEDIPRDAWHAARIATSLHEDCGPCTQLVVSMAERDGVSPAVLRSVLSGEPAAMPEDASIGYRFAVATLAHNLAQLDTLRDEILRRWGQRALVSLAFTIAAGRVFPTVKYVLGHGHACQQIRVAGAVAPFRRAELHA